MIGDEIQLVASLVNEEHQEAIKKQVKKNFNDFILILFEILPASIAVLSSYSDIPLVTWILMVLFLIGGLMIFLFKIIFIGPVRPSKNKRLEYVLIMIAALTQLPVYTVFFTFHFCVMNFFVKLILCAAFGMFAGGAFLFGEQIKIVRTQDIDSFYGGKVISVILSIILSCFVHKVLTISGLNAFFNAPISNAAAALQGLALAFVFFYSAYKMMEDEEIVKTITPQKYVRVKLLCLVLTLCAVLLAMGLFVDGKRAFADSYDKILYS